MNLAKSESQNTTSDVLSKPSVPLVSALEPSYTRNAVETLMSAQCAMPPRDVDVKGVKYTIKSTKMSYRTNAACTNAASVAKSHGSLIDGGANGGLAGADVRLVSTGSTKADVMGINDTTIADVPIGTVAGLIQTTEGPAIAVMHQYACIHWHR